MTSAGYKISGSALNANVNILTANDDDRFMSND